MNDTAQTIDGEPAEMPAESGSAKPEKKEEPFWRFLLKLVVIVVIFRSFIFSPFNIPSESMLPRLMNGDYLLAAKWPYGFSKYSLPFSAPLIPGRVFADQPERGDVVIFKAPPASTDDYIKRVIGVPGDQVAMRGGIVILNGEPVAKERIEDFEILVSANTDCARPQFEATNEAGQAICRYPQFRETLPGGRSFNTIDFGQGPADDFEATLVPEGQLFLMGDNRDNSQDSRFAAMPGGGIGLVPQDNLVGQASIVMWSTDGSAEWIKPWTWFTAARWDRIGGTF